MTFTWNRFQSVAEPDGGASIERDPLVPGRANGSSVQRTP
jgi:hypothetical protein